MIFSHKFRHSVVKWSFTNFEILWLRFSNPLSSNRSITYFLNNLEIKYFHDFYILKSYNQKKLFSKSKDFKILNLSIKFLPRLLIEKKPLKLFSVVLFLYNDIQWSRNSFSLSFNNFPLCIFIKIRYFYFLISNI